MRPLPGDDAFQGRQRQADNETTLFRGPSDQMTYFVADEEAVDASLQHTNAVILRQLRDREKERKSHHPPVTSHPNTSTVDSTTQPSDEASMSSSILIDLHETASSRATGSLPMTPVLGVSDHGSAVSSSSSRRNSLAGSFLDEPQSHDSSAPGPTVCSTTDVIQDSEEKGSTSLLADSGCTPQLIMPSIKMPSRRPFTDTGKNIGRLKVLIAGDSGTGKTCLIKAFVQTCEHIVHVDPIIPSPFSMAASMSKESGKCAKRPKPDSSTSRITEIYASTKPYPPWWSDMDDIKVLRRRKSLGDSVLERNLCFVDTPGYGDSSSAMDTMSPVVEYVERQLRNLSSQSLSDSEILRLAAGEGGCQVNAVFYVMSENMKPADIEYLRLLQPLTNVIPILSKADRMDSEELEATKDQIVSQLRQANIKPFRFDTYDRRTETSATASVYAVSSATGSDYETMDASLLMSSDYIEPLFPTDLLNLVERVFSVDGSAWLRHTSARKYLTWKAKHTASSVPPTSLTPSSSPFRGIPRALVPSPHLDLAPIDMIRTGVLTANAVAATPTSYSLARLADHTQREERLAQVRLANWANELQRTIMSERARYETLARNERAVWLTERLNECIQDGMLVPRNSDTSTLSTNLTKSRAGSSGNSSHSNSNNTRNRRRRRDALRRSHSSVSLASSSSSGSWPQDPLGLLEVAAKLKRRGRTMLELLGSVGVIGGVVFWISKYHSQQHFQVWPLQLLHISSAYEWAVEEWMIFWGMNG